MTFIRRRLGVLVLLVTAGQVATTAAASIALCGMSAANVDDDPAECTCGHGDGAQCPLHKDHQGSPAPSSSSPKDCRCSGVPSDAATLLTTIVSAAAPLVERRQVTAPEGASQAVFTPASPSVDVARPPVSPPPRG